MKETPLTHARLIAIDNDIVPFSHDEVLPEETDNALPATRTTANSEYVLSTTICTIGRDPSCQVCINKERTDISRKHAIIDYEAGSYSIRDKSLNGTFINGLRINDEPYVLKHKDIIGLGNSPEMLRFINTTEQSPHGITLTEREQQILKLLADGRRVKEIADELVISYNTVNTHLKKLYDKLNARNRTEAVKNATRLQLLKPPFVP